MDKNAFEEMKLTQDSHWWFKGKRAIIEKLLIYLNLPSNARILEIGCGTGSNLNLLSKFGTVTALEVDDDARRYASELSGMSVLPGWLPDGLNSVKDRKFDLICMFDVLEHVEKDVEGLIKIKDILADSQNKGKLIMTVPSYQWLYSEHDKKLSHFRRYSKKELKLKLREAGYRVNVIRYMNTLLFPLMLLARLTSLVSGGKDYGATTPNNTINKILFNIFLIEKILIPKVPMPYGGSIYAITEIKEN